MCDDIQVLLQGPYISFHTSITVTFDLRDLGFGFSPYSDLVAKTIPSKGYLHLRMVTVFPTASPKAAATSLCEWQSLTIMCAGLFCMLFWVDQNSFSKIFCHILWPAQCSHWKTLSVCQLCQGCALQRESPPHRYNCWVGPARWLSPLYPRHQSQTQMALVIWFCLSRYYLNLRPTFTYYTGHVHEVLWLRTMRTTYSQQTIRVHLNILALCVYSKTHLETYPSDLVLIVH